MTDRTFFIDRSELSRIFGDPRTVRQFETLQEQVAVSGEATTANVEETQALRDATYVTLSANAELPNERVLAVGPGLAINTDAAGWVRLETSVYTEGGWPVQFSVTGATTLALPTAGIVSTREGVETLTNKTLGAPGLTGLTNAADDAAAASAGVPVGGVYRDGSVLMVRVS